MTKSELDPADFVSHFEKHHVHPKKGKTLIVGSRIFSERLDRRTLYKNAIGIDMIDGPGVDRVLDLEDPLPSNFGPFAHIECTSVLEHSRRPWLMAENLTELLSPGGTIYITVPFIWRVHGYPDDYWRFTINGVKALFHRIEFSKVMFAHLNLTEKALVPGQGKVEGVPLFPRTQVLAFGIKPQTITN